MQQSVTVSPTKSIRRRPQQFHAIHCKEYRERPSYACAYKIQLVLRLKPADHQKRKRFCEWIEKRLAADENFAKNIIFSNEAHFDLSGFVNERNCRIRGSENPRVTNAPSKDDLWCGFCAGGVISPFCFRDDEGINGYSQWRTLSSHVNQLVMAFPLKY